MVGWRSGARTTADVVRASPRNRSRRKQYRLWWMKVLALHLSRDLESSFCFVSCLIWMMRRCSSFCFAGEAQSYASSERVMDIPAWSEYPILFTLLPCLSTLNEGMHRQLGSSRTWTWTELITASSSATPLWHRGLKPDFKPTYPSHLSQLTHLMLVLLCRRGCI